MTFSEWYEDMCTRYRACYDSYEELLEEAWIAGQQAEREACEKVCEQYGQWADEAYMESDSEFDAGESNGAYGCLHHIRRRNKDD